MTPATIHPESAMPPLAMPLSLYMTAPVITVGEHEPLAEVHRVLAERRISCVPVVDGRGVPVGVLSRTDLLRIGRLETRGHGLGPLLRLPNEAARAHMRPGIFTVAPATHVAQAAHVLVKRRIHRLFVEEAGRLVGVFSTQDLLVAIRDQRLSTPIGQAMASPAFTIPMTAPLSVAVDEFAKAHVSGLVVVDEEDWPIGTFTQTEALLARDVHTDTPVEDVMSAAILCLEVRTPLYRAAGQAHATRARRVLAVEHRRVKGVLTGLDFARAAS